MTYKPVYTASKQRSHQAYHTTLLLRHNICPDLIIDKLCYHFVFTFSTYSSSIQPKNIENSYNVLGAKAACDITLKVLYEWLHSILLK